MAWCRRGTTDRANCTLRSQGLSALSPYTQIFVLINYVVSLQALFSLFGFCKGRCAGVTPHTAAAVADNTKTKMVPAPSPTWTGLALQPLQVQTRANCR